MHVNLLSVTCECVAPCRRRKCFGRTCDSRKYVSVRRLSSEWLVTQSFLTSRWRQDEGPCVIVGDRLL